MGDPDTLTGEPQGRYVFAAFGPRGEPPCLPSIVAYAPDTSERQADDSVRGLEPPRTGGTLVGRGGGWHWLSASATRVYGMWWTYTYRDSYPAYVTHAVGNDGQLGPAYVRNLGECDHGSVIVDVESNVL